MEKRNRNVFRGSVLISLLVESYPSQFPDRTVACRFGRRLFKEGLVRSISGAKNFEDSAQLYVWQDQGQAGSDHGRNMTSFASTPGSYSNIQSERNSHKQLDWQLVEDIQNKLLNRSEAYNIVTSYNTFYQELQQDFGFDPISNSNKKSPLSEGDIGWSGTNAPYTSTLEHKKGPACSTDSSLDNQNCTGKAKESGKHIRNISKNPSTGLDNQYFVLKNSASHDSKYTFVNFNNHQKHGLPSNHNKQEPLQSGSDIKTMPTTGSMNSEQTVLPDDRLCNTNFQSEQQCRVLSPNTASMDHHKGPMRHGPTTIGLKTPAAPGNLECNTNINLESAGTRNNERRRPEPLGQQTQPVVPEVQRWLNPSAFHSGGPNEQYNLQNNRSEAVHDHVGGSRSRLTENGENGRRWPESTCSYSDNEKQLLEEMRRMKKEHQNVLRTYEGRINKLMAKMHELRNIAEMLEHSSNKSSPYGILPGKMALLNILSNSGGKGLDGKTVAVDAAVSEVDQVPPPLPPRPGRGSRVYPNKPIIHTNVTLKPLLWSRIIVQADAQGNAVWHGMKEPNIDTEELERLFTCTSDFPRDVNLYEDICLRRGRNQAQLVAIYDAERSQRITSELRALRCNLPEVIEAFVTLNCDNLHTDSFAELLELLTSTRELDKIFHHVKKKGASQLDVPEYLVYELSKIDHFRERLEFLRFKNKIQINLFEIDQQLRELQTACDEITSSVALKHVLETVLAVGNHMNAGTERGQADGFKVDILNSLKDVQNQGNLLELIMRMYCLKFESDHDFGCPTRFRLPEPSNMRHAAQVSFEDIQRALRELKDEMSLVRSKLEPLSKMEGSSLTIALRVTSENFMTSATEVLAVEQKLLEDTRTQFRKTLSFFNYDGQKSTPHEFFQIWASFLHDCKYYWKLAHRNLAKSKFHTDLTSKCQLSSSSLPGYNSLKSAMIKHVASFQQDEEMRASKSQHLQHINSWIQSVGRYTMEMQPEGVGSSQNAQDVSHNAESLPLHERNKLQSNEQQELEKGYNSPPYKNQTYSEVRRNVNSTTDHKQQLETENKLMHDPNSKQSDRSNYKVPEVSQSPSSPKPIKAIPPNVIKPQPKVRTSQKLPTTPSASSDLALVRPATSCQAILPEPKINEKLDDNFGFEPLYESLSLYSPNQPNNKFKNGHKSPHAEGITNPSGKMLPSDPESNQRKNAKFFKSLLKRDHKKQPEFQDNLQGNQDPSFKNTTAPFTKVKNTFIHKLSGSGNVRNNRSPNDYSHSNQTHIHETTTNSHEDLDQGAMFYYFPDKDTANFNSPRIERKDKDHVSYQNICFPESPRKQEGLSQTHTLNSLEANLEHAENIFYSNGHESFPSTISSLQSIKDRGQLNYQGNILLRKYNPAADQHNILDKGDSGAAEKLSGRYHSGNTDNDTGSTYQSSQSRVRAPIAIGSNMSLSEAYGKGTENAQTQTSGSYQSSYLESNDINQEKTSSTNSGVKTGISDPMWMKASPVPVYKAKLIPNYENQTKYDPSFQIGVKGNAEAVTLPAHAPPVSIVSDVYRQELQKKSEHYVAGGIYPSAGQVTAGNNNPRSGSLETPFAILPPKLNHFHVISSPTSVNNHMGSPLPKNSPSIYLQPSKMPQKLDYKQKVKSNPENGEAISSSDTSPKQTRQDVGSVKHIFTISSDKKSAGVIGCNTIPKTTEYDKKVTNGFSVYRSSSAHSILERDTDSRRSDVGASSAFVRPKSQCPMEQGHKYRKDSSKTMTSNKSQSEVISDPPQSVTSLIDRFEKKADVNNIGSLFDITDKPPSMTSTPVVRRKNQGVSTNQSIIEKPAAVQLESSTWEPEEARRSHSQKENMLEWQRNTSTKQTGTVQPPYQQYFSEMQHQNVASPYIQSKHEETVRISLSQHLQDNLVNTRRHKRASHSNTSKKYLHTAQRSEPERFSTNHKNQNHQEIYTHEAYNDEIWSKDTISNNQLKSGNSKNINQYHWKQKSANMSVPNSESYFPQYYLPETSTNQLRSNQQQIKSSTTPYLASDNQQSSYSPDYSNIPFNPQLGQSPASFIPESSSQSLMPHTFSSLPTPSNISNFTHSNEDVRNTEDFHYHSKHSSSAFDNTSKYVRQSGAIAVVKPAVLNI